MSLSNLTRDAVLAAIAEHDRVGRDAFLNRYGFAPARDYVLVIDGREYDSKAIAGAAHGYLGQRSEPLPAKAFSGGRKTVARTLSRLGFVVRNVNLQSKPIPKLTVGQVYSWEQLADAFEFDSRLFQVGGGMLSRPEHNALLLITHPGGARSFDYEDRWDGSALIYTGRGKTGDQRLDGPNRDVAENRKQLFVLEAAGSRQLRFLGRAVCTSHWIARAPDASGAERDVLKFRLAFDTATDIHAATVTAPPVPNRRVSPLRIPRLFSPDRVPSARPPEVNRRTTPEETAALQEKANQQHHRILSRLHAALTAAGWQEIEEIPAAVDLWAKTPDGSRRVIFEVKGLSGSNEIGQCRAALAQLLEYRFFYGADSDLLCLVVDRAIADRRRAFLESNGVGVVLVTGSGQLQPIGGLASSISGKITSPRPSPRQS